MHILAFCKFFVIKAHIMSNELNGSLNTSSCTHCHPLMEAKHQRKLCHVQAWRWVVKYFIKKLKNPTKEDRLLRYITEWMSFKESLFWIQFLWNVGFCFCNMRSVVFGLCLDHLVPIVMYIVFKTTTSWSSSLMFSLSLSLSLGSTTGLGEQFWVLVSLSSLHFCAHCLFLYCLFSAE